MDISSLCTPTLGEDSAGDSVEKGAESAQKFRGDFFGGGVGAEEDAPSKMEIESQSLEMREEGGSTVSGGLSVSQSSQDLAKDEEISPHLVDEAAQALSGQRSTELVGEMSQDGPDLSTAPLKLKIKLLPAKKDTLLKLRVPKKRRDDQVVDMEQLRRANEEASQRGEYCICGGPDNLGTMICCDLCGLWCHALCMEMTEQDCQEIERFLCPGCESNQAAPKRHPRTPRLVDAEKASRKSMRKRKIHDYNELNEMPMLGEKEIKAALNFREILKEKRFSSDNVVKSMRGEDLNLDFVRRDGLRVPIMVKSIDGLGMQMPPPTFTVEEVKNLVGPSRVLDVIEVSTQAEVNPQWTLGDWAAYYAKAEKQKKYNVISLEVTNTRLAERLRSPEIVRKIDWIDNVWPKGTALWPKVQLYCLMSVAGAYTDFHIDFGGSSVWYHVVYGQKLFVFIPPTEENLNRYAEWSSSHQQSDIFFGDKVDKCYLHVVNPGETLFIPTGWIHAVYTPEDSLVFGGNFLHGYNIKQQLAVYDIENLTGVTAKFRFPLYEQMMWYAAEKFLQKLEEKQDLTIWEYEGVLNLVDTLDSWLKTSGETSDFIPKTINPRELLDKLSKQVLDCKAPQDDIPSDPWELVAEENGPPQGPTVQQMALARFEELERSPPKLPLKEEQTIPKVKLHIKPYREPLPMEEDEEGGKEEDDAYVPEEDSPPSSRKKPKTEKKEKKEKPPKPPKPVKSPKKKEKKEKKEKPPKATAPAPSQSPVQPSAQSQANSPFKAGGKKQGKPQTARERIAKKLGVKVQKRF